MENARRKDIKVKLGERDTPVKEWLNFEGYKIMDGWHHVDVSKNIHIIIALLNCKISHALFVLALSSKTSTNIEQKCKYMCCTDMEWQVNSLKLFLKGSMTAILALKA